MLIGARLGGVQRGSDGIAQRAGGGADQNILTVELRGRHTAFRYVRQAVRVGAERSSGACGIDRHASDGDDRSRVGTALRLGNRHGGGGRVQGNPAPTEQHRLRRDGDAPFGGAIADAYGFHRHGPERLAGIVGGTNGDLPRHAIEFGLDVDMAHRGGCMLNFRQR